MRAYAARIILPVFLACLLGMAALLGRAQSPPPSVPSPGTYPLAPSHHQARLEHHWDDPSQPVEGEIFEPAQLVAVVGDQYIFRGDLLGRINLELATRLRQLRPEERQMLDEQELEAAREQFVRQVLQADVQRKMLFLAFLRTIPEDRRADAQKQLEARARDMFHEQLQSVRQQAADADDDELTELIQRNPIVGGLAALMVRYGLSGVPELEHLLRQHGTSIQAHIQLFKEEILKQQLISQSLSRAPEVTLHEMLEYYSEHAAQYERPARVRWQQLTARKDRFASRQEAFNAIAHWGNLVQQGHDFADVARRFSHGPTAQEGGVYSWTSPGALRNRTIDETLFRLPPGALSTIIEESEAFHIVRVIEREDAHRVPFAEAQAEIRDELRMQKRHDQLEELLSQLQREIPVWTIYDP